MKATSILAALVVLSGCSVLQSRAPKTEPVRDPLLEGALRLEPLWDCCSDRLTRGINGTIITDTIATHSLWIERIVRYHNARPIWERFDAQDIASCDVVRAYYQIQKAQALASTEQGRRIRPAVASASKAYAKVVFVNLKDKMGALDCRDRRIKDLPILSRQVLVRNAQAAMKNYGIEDRDLGLPKGDTDRQVDEAVKGTFRPTR